MSAILVSNFYDLQDGFNKSHRHAHLALDDGRKARSRHHASVANPPASPVAAKAPVFTMQQQQQQQKPNNLAMLLPLQQQTREHRKLDRSMSEPAPQPQLVQRTSSSSGSPTTPGGQQANSSRYKTELCRPFEENGTCKYGDKCQFAHGSHELRTLARHPKYKTELCRTFHTTGFCPYGPRCHFIHNSEESKKSLLTSLQHNRSEGGVVPPPSRPKALSIGSFSLGSAGELSPPSSLSASPTSLHSFFSDDPFYSPATTGSGTQHPHHQQACTAFSFSQDFAAHLAKAPLGNHTGFGGSQPSLSAGLQLADVQDRDVFSFDSPPSPVDSLSSELDGLSLGGPGGNSPVSCASPLGLLGPRLPIFSRLATSDSE